MRTLSQRQERCRAILQDAGATLLRSMDGPNGSLLEWWNIHGKGVVILEHWRTEGTGVYADWPAGSTFEQLEVFLKG